MKKFVVLTVVLGIFGSQLASALDCPFHNGSDRGSKLKTPSAIISASAVGTKNLGTR